MARVSPDALFGCMTPPIINKTAVTAVRRASLALRLRRQVGQMLFVTRCWPAGPFAPGVVVTGRPAPAPPVAVLPARPAPPAPWSRPGPSRRPPSAPAPAQAPLTLPRAPQ